MNDTRTCKECSEHKYLCFFPKTRKGRFSWVCRECKAELKQEKAEVKAKERQEFLEKYGPLTRHGILIKQRRALVLNKLGNVCVSPNCGESDPLVLYVVRQDAKPSLVKFSGDGLMRKLEEILAGLPEMELRCANCWKKRLANVIGSSGQNRY
jgi:hypothetical protein